MSTVVLLEVEQRVVKVLASLLFSYNFSELINVQLSLRSGLGVLSK